MRPKTLRKHYRDELDTGQVKASAKEPRACFARWLVMGRSQFSARAPTASSGALRGRTVFRGGVIASKSRSPRTVTNFLSHIGGAPQNECGCWEVNAASERAEAWPAE